MADCVFCKIAAGEIPCHKVYEDDHHIAFLDMGQVNPGHVIVALKAHSETIVDLDEAWLPLYSRSLIASPKPCSRNSIRKD